MKNEEVLHKDPADATLTNKEESIGLPCHPAVPRSLLRMKGSVGLRRRTFEIRTLVREGHSPRVACSLVTLEFPFFKDKNSAA